MEAIISHHPISQNGSVMTS